MDGVTAEAWLAQDVRDRLDDGPVGLYQFVWCLNGSDYGLSGQDAVALARRVARRFLDDGQAELFAVTWPDFDVVRGPLPVAVLDDPTAWSEGESGPLVALVPTTDGG